MSMDEGSLKMPWSLFIAFMIRYWYLLKAESVAKDHSNSESNGKYIFWAGSGGKMLGKIPI